MEAGDGTTTVVILAGSLLSASQKLLTKGNSCKANKGVQDSTSMHNNYIFLQGSTRPLSLTPSRQQLLEPSKFSLICPCRSLWPTESPSSRVPLPHSAQRYNYYVSVTSYKLIAVCCNGVADNSDHLGEFLTLVTLCVMGK